MRVIRVGRRRTAVAVVVFITLGLTVLGPIEPTIAETGSVSSLPYAGWEEVGEGSATGGGISNNGGWSYNPVVTTAPNGTVYVAWRDDTGTTGHPEIFVLHWNGSEWIELDGSASPGGISNDSDNSWNPSIAMDPFNSNVYVAWGSWHTGGSEIYILCWNGTSWKEVGVGSASGEGISGDVKWSGPPSISVTSTGTVYVAWAGHRGNYNFQVFVRRWNDPAWEDIMTIGPCSDWGHPKIALDTYGIPYVAWQGATNDGNSLDIYVKHWNGSAWEEVGAGSASGGGISNTGTAHDPSIAITDDDPYVVWSDKGIYTRRWNGSVWEEVGEGSASGGGISDNIEASGHPSISISPDNTPHVTWEGQGTEQSSDIYVRRWNGVSWVEVGTDSATNGGISDNAGASAYPSIAIAPNSTPYVAWFDSSGGEGINWQIYIRRYTSGIIHSISGRVVDGNNNPVADVIITDGTGHTTTTDGSGNYTLNGLAANTYTITPSKSGYTFSPYSRGVIVPPSKTGQDFVVAAPLPPCAVPFFSQVDGRWRDHPLRTCGTIGGYGCTLTSATMVFSYYGTTTTPPILSDCMGTSACPLHWGATTSCSGGRAIWAGKYGFDWARLDQELNQKHRPVMLGMHIKGNPSNTHWVVVVSGQGSDPDNYLVHDPALPGGANMRLSARTKDYDLYSLAVYDGQSTCGAEISMVTLSDQSINSVTDETDKATPPSVVSGEVLVYSLTEYTMTVQLIAQSSAADVTEMLVWTDSVTNSTWQPIETLITLPVSDWVYARFRDGLGNTSEVCSDSIFPAASPPDAPEPPPTISTINPDEGRSNLDVQITITGTDFVATPSVALDSYWLPDVHFVSTTTLTATVPAGLEPGKYDVTVRNPDGQSAVILEGYAALYPVFLPLILRNYP